MHWISMIRVYCICILYLLKITPLRSHSRVNCDTMHCPDYMPYCTPVGCVFQCPNNTFLNGTTCVINCGDMYIYNNTCFPTCPDTHHLVEVKIKTTGSQFREFRFCRATCPPKTLRLNGTCVKSCPGKKIFVENGTCLKTCSNIATLRRNMTLDNRLVGIECLSSCNGKYPFDKYGQCVSSCEETEVVANAKCSLKCPEKMQFQLDLQLCISSGACKSGWPEHTYCSESCPETSYVYNKTCRNECPAYAKYVWNGTCVSICPSTRPYHINRGSHSWQNGNYRKHLECTDQCPDKIDMLTMECVWYCQTGARRYNNMCVQACPNNTYIYDNKATMERMCVNSCTKFVQQDKCVDACPKLSMNKTCLDICPSAKKYNYKNTCISECPENTCLEQDGVNCTDDCSDNPKHVCPKHTPYRKKSDNTCISQCGVDEVLDDTDNCINVTECKKAVLSHGRCLDECPEGYLYMAINEGNYQNSYDSENTYSYSVKDLKNDPCVQNAIAGLPTIILGLFTLTYGIWFCLFVSPKQIKFLIRRKSEPNGKVDTQIIYDVDEPVHDNNNVDSRDTSTEEGATFTERSDETARNLEDITLIDIKTEEQTVAREVVPSQLRHDIENNRLIEVTIENQANQELTGGVFENSESLGVITDASEERKANQDLTEEDFELTRKS